MQTISIFLSWFGLFSFMANKKYWLENYTCSKKQQQQCCHLIFRHLVEHKKIIKHFEIYFWKFKKKYEAIAFWPLNLHWEATATLQLARCWIPWNPCKWSLPDCVFRNWYPKGGKPPKDWQISNTHAHKKNALELACLENILVGIWFHITLCKRSFEDTICTKIPQLILY